jgi:MSHA biogenesis protein MshK
MRGGSVFKFLLASALLYSAMAQASIEIPLDPTQPPASLAPARADEKNQTPVLQAILMGAQGSRAVINGQTLRVGDEYADGRVLAIYPQTVLIERKGKRELLRLAKSVIQPSR